MLTVHHLNQSFAAHASSGRWKAGVACQIVCVTSVKDHAGAAGIEKMHPLGKSPVIEITVSMVIAESGAVTRNICRTLTTVSDALNLRMRRKLAILATCHAEKVRSCPCY